MQQLSFNTAPVVMYLENGKVGSNPHTELLFLSMAALELGAVSGEANGASPFVTISQLSS